MNFTLSFNELMPLAPVMIVALTAIVVMILIAIKRNHNLVATTAVIGLNLALVSILLTLFAAPFKPESVMNLFMVDPFTLVYQVVILIAALACSTLSHAYIDSYKSNREELYLLMLISVAGAMLMVASTHFASFFISLELMSIPVYGMLAYTHQRGKSLEAGLKYLVLSATASAMLLMGMAFIYATLGSLSFAGQIDDLFWSLAKVQSPETLMALQGYMAKYEYLVGSTMVIIGLGLILSAVAFKLSMAPFHKWTPDVYAGAPSPMATFLATVAKVAMIALFIRYLLSSGLYSVDVVRTIITVFAVLSVLFGNLLALKQTNLKRILAYSSIAHFGYIMLAFVSVSVFSLPSIGVYLISYVLTTIGAFGVVTLMSSPYNNNSEAENLEDYRGLFWRRPILTATLTVMMLSLAGIPLTAGFIGKFMLIMSTVSTGQWFYAAMIIIGSGIGLYYYLRVMITLFQTPTEEQVTVDAPHHWGQTAGGIMVLASAAAVLVLGIYPDPMIQLAELAQMVNPLELAMRIVQMLNGS